jgi:pimeloyl-ACP methyl ester carboxylesterase
VPCKLVVTLCSLHCRPLLWFPLSLLYTSLPLLFRYSLNTHILIGHWCHLEQPERFNGALLEHFQNAESKNKRK